jgi:hypothetical protein
MSLNKYYLSFKLREALDIVTNILLIDFKALRLHY